MQNDYKEIDLSAWTKVGEGGNGTTYTCPQAVSKEFYTSKAVYDLGIPTPELFEIVRVGDEYGIKSQLITRKQSVGKLCGEHPELIGQVATRMAELGKQIHSTTANAQLPSMKELMLEALATTQMISGKKLKEVTAFVESLEDAPTMLHGDFSLGNLIFALSPQDGLSTFDFRLSTPYWIDLGRAAHGIPMFDLGHLYLFCNIFSKQKRVQEIAHMTQQQLLDFWSAFAKAYLSLSTFDFERSGLSTFDSFTSECKRFAALDVILLGHIQTLNWHERLFLGLLAKSLFKSE